MTKANDALRNTIVEFLPRLRRYAYALSGTRHDADDLLQITVERTLAKGVPDGVDPRRWMLRLCKNAWIDWIRSRRVRGENLDIGDDPDTGFVDGEQNMMNQMAVHEVDGAMAQLPDEQRAVLALIALEGCSYREAADILELPIGTVMSRVSRARHALIDRLHWNQGDTP